MLDRIYVSAASLSSRLAVLLAFVVGCAALPGNDKSDPAEVAKVEAKIEQVKAVADTAAAAASQSPSTTGVAGIAALVSALAAAGLSYYRNQTRKSDPAVSNALALASKEE